MKVDDITYAIIGCAMKVHRILGNGFQEIIYQRALAIEMKKKELIFKQEMTMAIYYEGIDVGTRRVDFFVENEIMVELKAVIELQPAHLAQAVNYCEAYNTPTGLLINFGAKSLDYHRVYNTKHPNNKPKID